MTRAPRRCRRDSPTTRQRSPLARPPAASEPLRSSCGQRHSPRSLYAARGSPATRTRPAPTSRKSNRSQRKCLKLLTFRLSRERLHDLTTWFYSLHPEIALRRPTVRSRSFHDFLSSQGRSRERLPPVQGVLRKHVSLPSSPPAPVATRRRPPHPAARSSRPWSWT